MSTFNLRTFGLVGQCIMMMGAITACTTTGTGMGSARNSDLHANFAWKSTDDRTGTLTATLSNAKRSPVRSTRSRTTHVSRPSPRSGMLGRSVAWLALLGTVSRYGFRNSLQWTRRREPR
jgi:hypothetical protein